jgi:hypothetical protein
VEGTYVVLMAVFVKNVRFCALLVEVLRSVDVDESGVPGLSATVVWV